MRKEDDVRLLAAALASYYEATRNKSDKRMFGLAADALRWVLEYPTQSPNIGKLMDASALNQALGEVLAEEEKKKKLAPKPPPNCA